MIMKLEPIFKAYESLDSKNSRVIFSAGWKNV